MKAPKRPDPNSRLWSKLVVETAGLFAPGLGHARALYERVRESHQADLIEELAILRGEHARLLMANQSLARTVEMQQAYIARLDQENDRLRRRFWFRR